MGQKDLPNSLTPWQAMGVEIHPCCLTGQLRLLSVSSLGEYGLWTIRTPLFMS